MMLRSARSLYAGGLLSATLLVYLTYACYTKNHALRDVELRLDRLLRVRDQMTAQLQVVTDHRQRLEQSVDDYKNKLQLLKEEAQNQRDKFEAAINYANNQMRQAEKTAEAARLDHRRAIDQLRKVKNDEVQRLTDSLAAQRRWCNKLQEKFDAEYVQPKGREARSVHPANRDSAQIGIRASASTGLERTGDGNGRSKPTSSAVVVGAGAYLIHAASAVDDGIRPLPQERLSNGNDRWPEAARPGNGNGHGGRQVSFARNDPVLDVNEERSAFQEINKINVAHVDGEAEDLRQDAGLPAEPDFDRDEYLEHRAARNGDAGVGRYNAQHRRRLHDADEIAGDPRELTADAAISADQGYDEVGKVNRIT